MALPTFLGVGVSRGGTTLLHTLLDSYPEVYMPTRRKEVCFSDLDYERGLGWYEAFFPPPEYDKKYRVVGEISPHYYKRGSFEDFFAARPEILEQGLYSQYIKRYLRYFDRTQILALLFEDAVTNTIKTKAAMADFLDIAPDNFPSSSGGKKVNASSMPKNRFLWARKVARCQAN